MELTCKLQYKIFEPGEFVDERKVDYDEAITIIEKFPWEKERENIVIDVTCPSVTFQNDVDNYLKFALYYNSKFVLYYFNGEALFTKSCIKKEDAYSYINYYFKHKEINEADFKKEITWFKQLQKHFVSNPFIYKVTKNNPFAYVNWFTELVMLIVFSACVYFAFKILDSKFSWGGLIALCLYFITFVGVNFLLLFNYYFYCQNKTLQLSKGSSVFSFGSSGNVKTYSKADILQIVVKQNKGSRCPWHDFTLTFIEMKDGTEIKVPSVLLSGSKIIHKMPGVTSFIKHAPIPFCKWNYQVE